MQGGDELNKGIRAWGKDTIHDLQGSFDKLGIEHVARSPSTSPSRDALVNRFASRGGMINRVGFKFPRHMVFVHKGVGKGTPINKVGTTTRKAKEWFNPVMDDDIEKLANEVAKGQADLIVKNLLIN